MLTSDYLYMTVGTNPSSQILLHLYSLSYFSKRGNSHICLVNLDLFDVIDTTYMHCIIAMPLRT